MHSSRSTVVPKPAGTEHDQRSRFPMIRITVIREIPIRRADGRYIVDICDQCGYEQSAGRAGRPPDCEVREVPSRLLSVAKRHDLLPETSGAREDSMLGVPSGATEMQE